MNKEIKKHAGVIKSTSVGLLPRKIWNILLLNAYDDLTKKRIFKISFTDLSELLLYNSQNYKKIKLSLQKLQTTLIEWDIGGTSNVYGISYLNFSSVQMLGKVTFKDGIITYSYDDELKEILHTPALYQKISIAQQNKLRSTYGINLWENCLRFIKVGSTGFLPVNDWRKILGAKSKSYDAFKLFNSKVLKPAIDEVNKVTDIQVELITKKTGRKVTEIGFKVSSTPKVTKNLLKEHVEQIKKSPEFKALLNYGVDELKAKVFIKDYGCEYIQEKIRFLKSQANIVNPPAFLIRAIQGDWKTPEQIANNEHEAKKMKQVNLEQKAEEERKEEQARSKKNRQRIAIYLKDLPQNEIQEIEEKFIKEMRKSPIFSIYFNGDKIDLNKTQVQSLYYNFVQQNYLQDMSS